MAPPSPSFTVFPNLPLELRCLIWEKTCEPRIVEVSYEDDGFSSLSSVPMALRVCKESRDTVIHSYPLCFGSIFYPPKIRFNFTLDTLYIDNKIEEDIPHFFSTLREREISSLRFLAIDGYFVGPTSQYDVAFISNMRRAVKSLTGLKELLVVFDLTVMTSRTLGCGADHFLELFDDLPKELQEQNHKLHIDPLPCPEDLEKQEFHLWEAPVCRPVYGWRRCPVALPIDSDSESDPGSDFGDFLWRSRYQYALDMSSDVEPNSEDDSEDIDVRLSSDGSTVASEDSLD
jgi:hypothetical protein